MRVCGVRNVRKTGNVGFMRVYDMLAMCGRRVRNYSSAHAPSGTLTFWRRFDGARPVPAINEATGNGAGCARASGRRIFLMLFFLAVFGAIPSVNQATAQDCAQVLPGKGSERVALRPAAG